MKSIVLLLALVSAASTPALAQEYQPAFVSHNGMTQGGSEIVLVYYGMTSCVPCHAPEFKTALEQAKVALAERAVEQGKSFAAVGVALDWDVTEGFTFLQEAGAFDEVAIGRNWENAAALTHLWRPDGLEDRQIAIPSIIVFEREILMDSGISASEPVYLYEVAGAPALAEWVEAGLPLE